MKLALIERDIDIHNKPDTPPIPGKILWSTYDYFNRRIIFLVENDLGPEVPTLVEITTVNDVGQRIKYDVKLPSANINGKGLSMPL